MRQYYHEKPRFTNRKHQVPAIAGGSYSIPPIALLMVWAAYKRKKLDWLALRIWIAIWEIRCWHETRKNSDFTPHYNTSHITAAIRSSNLATKRVLTSLSALERLNLVRFTSSTAWVATRLDDLRDPQLRRLAEQMLSDIGHTNLSRGLRMPRRMLVFLMTRERPRPVYAGVMLALLVRTMLTKRYGAYKGCCTATWIAMVFGGDISSIKSARARIIRDGWFARLDTPQRVRQQYGEWVVLSVDLPVENFDETEPPTPQESGVTEPPSKNQSLSEEIKTNQSLTPGASQPQWENIQPLDLHTPARREQIYQAAVTAGVIRCTEAHRLSFFAAIAHATRVARRNACGLLRRLVETPAYHRFISQVDEDQASLWLKRKRQIKEPRIQFTTDLTHDQQIATYLRRRFHSAGFSTHNLFALSMTTDEGKRLLAGWTQDRWEQASLTADGTHRQATSYGLTGSVQSPFPDVNR